MVYQDPQTALNPAIIVGEQVAEAYREHERVGRDSAWARALGLKDATKGTAAATTPAPPVATVAATRKWRLLRSVLSVIGAQIGGQAGLLALLAGKSMEARNYTRGAANLATDHPA